MRIDEFMTTRIASIDADRSVYDAIEKMVDKLHNLYHSLVKKEKE